MIACKGPTHICFSRLPSRFWNIKASRRNCQYILRAVLDYGTLKNILLSNLRFRHTGEIQNFSMIVSPGNPKELFVSPVTVNGWKAVCFTETVQDRRVGKNKLLRLNAEVLRPSSEACKHLGDL